MSERPQTWHPAPRATTTVLPKGATDCHCHVFGPKARFPYAAHNNEGPADAPKEALFALHDRMGIDRCVIVQSGVHGFDNSPRLTCPTAPWAICVTTVFVRSATTI